VQPDTVAVVLLAAGPSLAVALVGAAVLRMLRARSLRTSIVAVAVISVLAVLAGAVGTARAMFLSSYDFEVLLIVAGVAGTVGIACAVLLGRSVLRGMSLLGDAAQSLGDWPYTGATRPLPSELAVLDRALATTSRRLAESAERERTVERSRRELVAWVSHDLRTPLAGIRAMSEALEDGVVTDAPTVARYHAGIRLEADRLAALVDDLFELSRIHAGVLSQVVQDVSLADLLSDALASAGPVAEAKGVRLIGTATADLPVVRGNQDELGRVLRNLLANAIRHTPVDGVVHVSAHADDGVAHVDIDDACGGIPDADLPRLFDVAFRGTAARTPGDGGAGLGLAIAKGLVEAHHGEIHIGNYGPGCRVSVRLPARPEGSAARRG